MRSLFLFLFLLTAPVSYLFAQVGVNDTGAPPDPKAMLDVSSDSKVFLPPRMTTAERDAIVSPPAGGQIYNTDINCMEYYRGLSGGWFSMCPMLPTVTTSVLSSITGEGALSGGNVAQDGGAFVSARGVCWSTSQNPTLSDDFTTDGNNIGSFVSSISGLLLGTTYYVRAYATNSVGTAYGNEVSFTTLDFPSVTTSGVTTIYGYNAMGGGTVTGDGGDVVTGRGLCWSLLPNPTINDATTLDGSGIGAFTGSLGGLSASTQYYVRAFAVNSVGTAYGNEVTFTTTSGTVQSFTSTGSTSWTVPVGVTSVSVLVVGGGGGGGGSTGGGGGAGGLIYYGPESPRAGYYYAVIPGQSVSVTVGAGGQGSQWAQAGPPNNTNGGNSVFGTITAIGGGYGSSGVLGGGRAASSGGSGGGGCLYYENIPNPMNPGSGTGAQGNAGGGGAFTSDTGTWLGAGGGGAGAAGGAWNIVTKVGGNGGAGLTYSISGSAQTYAGGGGGAGTNGGGAGGSGGGGAGVKDGLDGIPGVPNTGGGGGASDRYQMGSGASGGSGIVVVRY